MKNSGDHSDTLVWARLAAALLIALAAAYFLLTNTLAFAIPNGALAHQLAPWSGVADGKLTEQMAQQAKSMAEAPATIQVARSTLAREPYDFRAARTLASIDVLSGRGERAERVFQLIGRYTLREPFTHLRLLSYAYDRKDNPDIVKEAEILLRQRPQMAAQVYPFLIYLVDNRLATGQLIDRLNQSPAWRSGFFDAMGEQSRNSDAAYAFLRALGRGPRPATSSELRVWLLYELGRNGGDLVTARWHALQPRLSAREQLLRNPDFEGSTAPQPFDWTFYAPEGSFAEIGPSPTGRGKALYAEMVGREDVAVASQMLNLAPGEYVLTAKVYPVSDTSRAEAALDLTCAKGKTFVPLARKPIVAPTETWSQMIVRFRIPDGCLTQRLSIDMRPGALSAEQRIYFDDMSVRRGH